MRNTSRSAEPEYGRATRRLELAWAWLSLATLILCWDAAARLDADIRPPRVRIAHAGERLEAARSEEAGGRD